MTRTISRWAVALTLVASMALAPSLGAQGHGRRTYYIPRGHLPPAGLCRIWIEGVPPGRQPPPIDCRAALRRAPRNAYVVTWTGYVYVGHGHWARWDRYEGVEYRRHHDEWHVPNPHHPSVCSYRDRDGYCVELPHPPRRGIDVSAVIVVRP